MTGHALATAASAPLASRRTIRCGKCESRYVPAEATICDCVTDHRTLRCPSCLRCSCSGRAVEVSEYFKNATPEEISHLNAERQRERQPTLAPEQLQRPLVLIADDNFDIRNIVRKLVSDLGYGVVAVENGEDAWTAAQELRPDIALLDGLMPKADGRVVSKRIKDDPTLSTRTVIMTSLFTSPAQREEAFREFKVDAYLAKPVSAEVLKSTLAALLAGTTES